MVAAAEMMPAVLTPVLSRGLVELCRARPADPVQWLGEWLLAQKPPLAVVAAAERMQSAFVFVKPHANTPAVRDMVLQKFASKGIEVRSEGTIDGPTIDSKKLIDQRAKQGSNNFPCPASEAVATLEHGIA